MRKYCVLLIGLLVFAPAKALYAADAHILAVLDVRERSQVETYEAVAFISRKSTIERYAITWGSPDIVIEGSTALGIVEGQRISPESIVDFSHVTNLQELSVY